jgi:Uma2 family endonuclease
MAQPMARSMTLAEFDALPEDSSARYELQEGVLQVTARPRYGHQKALVRLLQQLSPQLPAGWAAVPDMEVLVERREPATVRVPDLLVLREPSDDATQVAAEEVAVVVEIISRGSRNIDLHLKAFEYGEAGIPQYWVVDLDPPAPTITVFTLGAPGEGYDEQPAVAGELRTTVDLDGPVLVTVDVAALG